MLMLASVRQLSAGSRMVVALIGGRLVYRLALYTAGLGLLAFWGPTVFAGYAGAIGAVGWLFALTSSGPEKAALTFMPVGAGASLERLFIRLAVTPFALLLVGWLVTVLVAPSAGIQVAAAALMAGVGCSAVLVGLYRIHGRPLADVLAYLAIAASYGLVLALAVLAGLSVHGVLAVLIGCLLVVDLVLVIGLLRRASHERPTPAATKLALQASVVLGVGELLETAATSVLYAFLAIAGDARETSFFYVLMIVAGSMSVGWSYLLRLARPRLVSWLATASGGTGRALVRRMAAWTFGPGVLLTGALVLVAVAWGSSRPIALLTLVVEVLLYFAITAAAVVLESVDARGRHGSAGGAILQFAAVAIAAWWFIPAAGAAGAFSALCIGCLVKAAVLYRISAVVED
ncbi:MAG: hypothetical protein QOI10_4528 [Solirubrobacterales bacterium]|nr:hypothetical protein [Solirubrobacterales bacterium]